MNNRSAYICLCKSNFTGEDCSITDPQCADGYCSVGSLCQSNSRGGSLPLCLCPAERVGQRCSMKNDRCLSSPCLNNGSCFPHSQSDQVICLCPEDYAGAECQWRRPSIRLSLSSDLIYQGVVIQYFRIDLISLDLILLDQQVFSTPPRLLEYFHRDQTALPDIVLAKVYSSQEEELHLLSLHLNIISIHGRTEISSINRCEHLRTFSNGSLSPIRYHQICIADSARLCFRDDLYLCLCAENHTRVECFLYEDQLDRCEHCLADGRCLKGNARRSTDFVCLCPSCSSGQQCQFDTTSFSFTLDQLFSSNLHSDQKQRTMSLIILFPLLGFVVAIPTNLFSFVTLRRHACLHQGVGHYLLWMSVVNQLTLALLIARLVHLTMIITMPRSSPLVDDLFCKVLHYLLTCFTRLSSWLPSFVALERAYTTLFLSKKWFKQPRVARSLMILTFGLILLSTVYELVFVKSFASVGEGNRAMCVIQYPSTHRSMWTYIHQIVVGSHFLLPLLINICSTLTIISIVIRSKMNIGESKQCSLSRFFRNAQ